jgi:hypothetical protein
VINGSPLLTRMGRRFHSDRRRSRSGRQPRTSAIGNRNGRSLLLVLGASGGRSRSIFLFTPDRTRARSRPLPR